MFRYVFTSLLAIVMVPLVPGFVAAEPPAQESGQAELLALAATLCGEDGDHEMDIWWDEARDIRLSIHSRCIGEPAEIQTLSTCTSRDFSLKPWRWVVPYSGFYNTAGSAVDPAFALTGARDGSAIWQDEVIPLIYRNTALDPTFSRPAPEHDDENVHAWVSLGGSTLGTAFTWYHAAAGVALESDVVYNKDKAWEPSDDDAPSDRFNYLNTALHEMGHVFGLGHTTTDEDNRCLVMYPFSSRGEDRQTLGDGDVRGIKVRYQSGIV